MKVARRTLVATILISCTALASASSAQEIFPPVGPKPGGPDNVPLESITPRWGNPFLSFLPDEARPNWAYWRETMRRRAGERAPALPAKVQTVAEEEFNDTAETAQHLDLGTRPGQAAAIQVLGDMPAPPDALAALALAEDEGSIPLATPLAALLPRRAVRLGGTIGDGPYGSAGTGSGDFDFYAIHDVRAGQTIRVDIDTPPSSRLDSFVALYDETGRLIHCADDSSGSVDSLLLTEAPRDGTYYVSVGGWGPLFLQDPFDSSSGSGDLFRESEGAYEVLIGLDYYGDVDFFSFTLSAGDVLGATSPTDRATLYDPTGQRLIGSSQDASGVFPSASPLPGGQTSVLSYVIPRDGPYRIRVESLEALDYSLVLQVVRPGFEGREGDARPILYLDFDGAVVDNSIFGVPLGKQVHLEPLAVFLERWGLDAADKDAVIDAVLVEAERALREGARLVNRNFDFELRNSRDHADPFGKPDVSRVVVGGRISTLGIATIGIAQSIDPGNFAAEETAGVLLDILSSENEFSMSSLNNVERHPTASMVDLVGVAVGRIAAHEAGHFIGSFHTDQFFTPPGIMDQGGNLGGLLGLGEDKIFGSPDDEPVDFIVDTFVPNEGFTGDQDTLAVNAFGLTSAPLTILTAIPTTSPGGALALALILLLVGARAARMRGGG